MTLTALNRPLTDLGGVPVLWDSDVGTLVQDPTQGGTNQYGPGDLFRDPANGDLYQLEAGGQLSLYQVHTAAPTVAAPPGAPTTAGVNVPSTRTGAATTPAVTATGNPTQWGHQAVTWLSKASFLGGLPNGILVLLGYIAYSQFRRRRRNPGKVTRRRRRYAAHAWAEGTRSGGEAHRQLIRGLRASPESVAGRRYYKGRHERRHTTGSEEVRELERRGFFPRRSNPGRARRAARREGRARQRWDAEANREYIRAVRGVAGGERGERRGRLEQTYALGQRLGKLQRRGVREVRIGGVWYRLNPDRKPSRKPAGGPRVVYNRLLGGWYVVRGPHQTPIGGRFDSKPEAQAWLRRRNPGKAARAARREYRHKQRGWYAEPASAFFARGMRGSDVGRAELARLRYGYKRGARHRARGVLDYGGDPRTAERRYRFMAARGTSY